MGGGREGRREGGRQEGRDGGREGGRQAGRDGGREGGREGRREAGRQVGRYPDYQSAYEVEHNSCLFERLFKVEKNGVFPFAISFFCFRDIYIFVLCK